MSILKRIIIINLFFFSSALSDPVEKKSFDNYQHGIAMHGDLKYPKNFKKFEYANENAFKGGKINRFSIGTFDNLNPYILKGVPAYQAAYLFETLMKSSFDEPFSQYGLLAEGVKVPADRSWVAFKIRKEARFSDGTKVTPMDVKFSFETIMSKGHPTYKTYWGQVDKVDVISKNEVKFFFKGDPNPELPLIIGYQLPIFSKNDWEGKDFSKTTLTPPLGSGPYLISDVKAGRSLTLKKNNNYWGKDLNVNIGRYNFETIHYDYYRDETVALEAFKSGAYDFKQENSSKNWATAYKFPAVKEGKVKVEEIKYYRPSGMQGFAYNTRKTIFKNRNVRKALTYAFDFEWSNRNLFYNAYTRTKSFFDNSELSSQNLPSDDELKILEKYRGKIPDEVFTSIYTPPNTAEENGLRKTEVKLDLNSIKELISAYTREAGVRQLERQIANVLRKVARDIVESKKKQIKVTKTKVHDLLGASRFHSELAERSTEPGVVTGLAWTAAGGDILFIESTKMQGKGKLTLTGQLGDVMKESAFTALSYLKSNAEVLDINYKIFNHYDLHVHVPAGAIPKDGPSAGITILTALASLFTQRKVKAKLAMTGEITLRGKVLPVGGVKEKILAAKRAGIKEIILGKKNKKDIDEIDDRYLKLLKIHFVENVDDVLNIALLEGKVKQPLKFIIPKENIKSI